MNKTIYLAGGCFWGMQAYFEKIKGVVATEVGYINGPSDGKITYEEVCKSSGHAEVVKVTYDEDVLTKEDIFALFLRVIDPYAVNKQGEDEGVQYRTGIYSDSEKDMLEFGALLDQFEAANKKTAIELMPVHNYFKAEANHQDYLKNNPSGYCHINLNNIPEEFKK